MRLRALLLMLALSPALLGWRALTTVNAADRQVTFSLELKPELGRFTGPETELLEMLNRRDVRYLHRAEAVIVPSRFDLPALEYSPLPHFSTWAAAQQGKAIIVDIPSQVFGAYEFGKLIRWGPLSSGRKQHPTPAGHFHLNWRSRHRYSTENPAWELRWYYNFHNTRGIAFHEYAMPGAPASHACIRLLARDAEWLYHWGEGWVLTPDQRQIERPGTPVWITGEYDFDAAPPWLDPAWWRTRIQLPEPPSAIPRIGPSD